MAKKKLVLDFDFDFIVFAISCHAKDYRLCWNLNKVLGIELSKKDDYQLDLKQSKKNSTHSFYSYNDETNRLKYSLVSNRSDIGFLIEEHKETDYFFIIEGFYDLLDLTEMLHKIKSIDIVLTSFKIDPYKLKSKQNLIFS